MFPIQLGTLYLDRLLSSRVELLAGHDLPNDVFAGYENPLRHSLQGHCVEQDAGCEQYRDWFVHALGLPLVAGLGTPVRRGWQFPPATATAFFTRLFELSDEAISAGRYYTYAVPTGAAGLSWRATAVSAGGLIIPLQWHGVWCPWTLCFSASCRTVPTSRMH